jgi:prolipoprotein diacylglyceryltransferase
MLTDEQKEMVAGPYRCLKVLPTQLFDSGYTLTLAGVMFLFWRFWASGRPGLTMAMMMWLYGMCRFFNETFRDDNPFEYAWWTLYKGGTISQNISLYMILAGMCLTLFFLLKKQVAPKGR